MIRKQFDVITGLPGNRNVLKVQSVTAYLIYLYNAPKSLDFTAIYNACIIYTFYTRRCSLRACFFPSIWFFLMMAQYSRNMQQNI
jgi:hypothetical protein